MFFYFACIYLFFSPHQEKDKNNFTENILPKERKNDSNDNNHLSTIPRHNSHYQGKLTYCCVTLGKSHNIFGTHFPYQLITRLYKCFDFLNTALAGHCEAHSASERCEFFVFDDDIAISTIWEFHLEREKASNVWQNRHLMHFKTWL